MPQFFYGKKGFGTRPATSDTPYTTQQIVSFATLGAANVYDSINDIYDLGKANDFVDGDQACLSDLHDEDFAANAIINTLFGANLISVDDTNVGNYKAGAHLKATGGVFDLTLGSATSGVLLNSKGVDLTAQDNISICGGIEQTINLEDCTLALTGTSGTDIIDISKAKDGCGVNFKNVNVSFNNVGQSISVNNGVNFNWQGGEVLSSIEYLLGNSGNGGCHVVLDSLKLENLTSGVSKLLGSSNQDVTIVEVNRCTLASGVELDDSTVLAKNSYIEGHSIGIGAGGEDDIDYFLRKDYQGLSTKDTAVFRTAGVADYSVEIVGGSNTTFGNPLIYKIFDRFIDTANFTTDITFTVHLARDNGTLLQDNEFYIVIEHADGAKNALGVIVSTKPDPLTTGINLTNEAGGWTHDFVGSEGTDFEFMNANSGAITIGASAGNIASGVVRIFACLTINDTVFVDADVVIS